MAVVKIDSFGGIAPRRHPTQLADGMAVVAHNCRLKNGKLVPLREPELVEGANVLLEAGLSGVKDAHSMHIWRRANGDFDFLLFGGVTWSAPGNIAADDLTRIVVSGETGVSFDGTSNTPVVYMRDRTAGKVIYPIAKNPIGHPVVSRMAGPLRTSDVEIVLKGYKSVDEINELGADATNGWSYILTDDGEIALGELSVIKGSRIVWDGSAWAFPEDVSITTNIRYTRFFYTWVDKYGMESPVSAPSRVLNDDEEDDDDLEYLDGDKIVFSKPKNIPPSAVLIRVYKVVTGTEEGRVQFIAEFDAFAIGEGGFTVTVKDEDAGEIMPEIEAPPADLRCIHDVPGAFYVGFAPSMPKTVCFSDVDLLYSWPIAYRYDVADNLVALAVTSNSVFALTEGWPYVISGTAPESMSVAKLAGPAACVSARGVCVYRNAVYFVSNVGLMTIFNSADAGTVCQNLTDKIFTKDQWLALNPSSCLMGQHDGALFLYFSLADGTHKGLTIDLMENAAAAVTTHDEAATCLCVDTREDRLYFVREEA